jgi:hypothetical protein
MALSFHRDEVPPSSVHPIEYYLTTDPASDPDNNVAADKQWLKTDNLATPTWFELYRRNTVNTAWILIRAWTNDLPYAEGTILIADGDGRLTPLLIGASGEILVSDGATLAYAPNTPAIEIQDAGVAVGVRPAVNLIEGSNVTLTIADNVGDDRVDVTIAASGGGGTVDIEDEGAAEGAADTIDFVGAGVSVTFAAGQATVDIPGGAAGTVDIEDEGAAEGAADTIDFVGAGVSVAFAGGEATVTIPGGGGAWTQAVDEDGTSFAGWTSISGTWASNGTQITQTDTAATDRHAHLTAVVPNASAVLEADVKIVSGAGTPSRVGFVLAYNATLAGATIVYLEGDNTSGLEVQADRAVQAELSTVSFTFTYGTFYHLKVLIAGSSMSVWVDDVLKFSATNNADNAGTNRDTRYFGLYSYQASVQFQNIALYRPTLPGE